MEEKKPSAGKWKKGVLCVVVLVAVLAGVLIGRLLNRTTEQDKTAIAGDAVPYAEDRDYSDLEESNSIAIPGYDTLVFQAGDTVQKITLHNPAENTCYFKMRLILADGTTIWTSDLLEPGMAFDEIELTQPLEEGTYPNVTLKYDCYSLKDQSQLNGAEIKVTIEAR